MTHTHFCLHCDRTQVSETSCRFGIDHSFPLCETCTRRVETDPVLAEKYRDLLPCSDRGYHRCDCCGLHVLPGSINQYAFGWCQDCDLDLYPSRSAAMREAAIAARALVAHAETRLLVGKEEGR